MRALALADVARAVCIWGWVFQLHETQNAQHGRKLRIVLTI
jgi:hypothetical protein